MRVDDYSLGRNGCLAVVICAATSVAACFWLYLKTMQKQDTIRRRRFSRQIVILAISGLFLHLATVAMGVAELAGYNDSSQSMWCTFFNPVYRFGRNSVILVETHIATGFILQSIGSTAAQHFHAYLVGTQHLRTTAPASALFTIWLLSVSVTLLEETQLHTKSTQAKADFGLCPDEPHFDGVAMCLVIPCFLAAVASVLVTLNKSTQAEGEAKHNLRCAAAFTCVFVVTFAPMTVGWAPIRTFPDTTSRLHYHVFEYICESLIGLFTMAIYWQQKQSANRLMCEALVVRQLELTSHLPPVLEHPNGAISFNIDSSGGRQSLDVSGTTSEESGLSAQSTPKPVIGYIESIRVVAAERSQMGFLQRVQSIHGPATTGRVASELPATADLQGLREVACDRFNAGEDYGGIDMFEMADIFDEKRAGGPWLNIGHERWVRALMGEGNHSGSR